MLIGENYDKIEFEFLGLELLEPNTFIGDTLLFIFSMYFYFRIRKGKASVFTSHWLSFYLVFGFGFLIGGFGHLLYNYWSTLGKMPSWYLSVLAAFYIETAMISLLQNVKTRKVLVTISRIKLALALLGVTLISIFVDLAPDYSKGMIVPTLNSTIGLVSTLGILGYIYAKKNPGFRYFWISVLVLFPAAIIQAINLNIHPWFDKNDAGHALLILSIWLYYKGVRAYQDSTNS